MLGGLGGDLLAALLTAGAFAAFLSTSSGLTMAVAGVLSQDVLGAGVRAATAGVTRSGSAPSSPSSSRSSLALAGRERRRGPRGRPRVRRRGVHVLPAARPRHLVAAAHRAGAVAGLAGRRRGSAPPSAGTAARTPRAGTWRFWHSRRRGRSRRVRHDDRGHPLTRDRVPGHTAGPWCGSTRRRCRRSTAAGDRSSYASRPLERAGRAARRRIAPTPPALRRATRSLRVMPDHTGRRRMPRGRPVERRVTTDARATIRVYDELHDDRGLHELRQRYRALRVPGDGRVPVWYLLYVVMSNWAHRLHGHQGRRQHQRRAGLRTAAVRDHVPHRVALRALHEPPSTRSPASSSSATSTRRRHGGVRR